MVIGIEVVQALEALRTHHAKKITKSAAEWSLEHSRISQGDYFRLFKALSDTKFEISFESSIPHNLKIQVCKFNDEQLCLISAFCKQAITGALRALEAVDRLREAEIVNKSCSYLKPQDYKLRNRSNVEHFLDLWQKYGLNSCFFMDFVSRFAIEISILHLVNRYFCNMSQSEAFFLAENLANWEAIISLINPESPESWEVCDEVATTIFELTFRDSSAEELEQIKDYYFLNSAQEIISNSSEPSKGVNKN